MKITELFERGEFVVSAEVGPPKGIHIEHTLEEAKTYLSGITAVNVTDNQSSVMRLGSLAVCKALKDKGLTPIYQLTCRDRNRIALQSDLLSAAMLGIENILCLTGDHTKMGDHPQAKPVFDLDSVSLLHTVTKLESGVDLGGNELVGEPPKFAKVKNSNLTLSNAYNVNFYYEDTAGSVTLNVGDEVVQVTPFTSSLWTVQDNTLTEVAASQIRQGKVYRFKAPVIALQNNTAATNAKIYVEVVSALERPDGSEGAGSKEVRGYDSVTFTRTQLFLLE